MRVSYWNSYGRYSTCFEIVYDVCRICYRQIVLVFFRKIIKIQSVDAKIRHFLNEYSYTNVNYYIQYGILLLIQSISQGAYCVQHKRDVFYYFTLHSNTSAAYKIIRIIYYVCRLVIFYNHPPNTLYWL